MRRIVISGPPPVQILDATGPLEVFSNAPGYRIEIATPDDSHLLRTNRGISLTNATAIQNISGPIDTLIIAGGPGSREWGHTMTFISDGLRKQPVDPGALHRFVPEHSYWLLLDFWMVKGQ